MSAGELTSWYLVLILLSFPIVYMMLLFVRLISLVSLMNCWLHWNASAVSGCTLGFVHNAARMRKVTVRHDGVNDWNLTGLFLRLHFDRHKMFWSDKDCPVYTFTMLATKYRDIGQRYCAFSKINTCQQGKKCSVLVHKWWSLLKQRHQHLHRHFLNFLIWLP